MVAFSKILLEDSGNPMDPIVVRKKKRRSCWDDDLFPKQNSEPPESHDLEAFMHRVGGLIVVMFFK